MTASRTAILCRSVTLKIISSAHETPNGHVRPPQIITLFCENESTYLFTIESPSERRQVKWGNVINCSLPEKSIA